MLTSSSCFLLTVALAVALYLTMYVSGMTRSANAPSFCITARLAAEINGKTTRAARPIKEMVDLMSISTEAQTMA
jgi:hypothetical protein